MSGEPGRRRSLGRACAPQVGLDDPDVVAVGVLDGEHPRDRAFATHHLAGGHAVDRRDARVLGLDVGRLDADAAAARLPAHRRVEREAGRRAGRGDLDPAVAALVAEGDVGAQLPAEGLRVERDRRVLIGDREHRDADVGDGRGDLRGIAHAPKTARAARTHRSHDRGRPERAGDARDLCTPRWRRMTSCTPVAARSPSSRSA